MKASPIFIFGAVSLSLCVVAARADEPQPDRQAIAHEPLALTGDPVPGLDGLRFIQFPHTSFINDAGYVVFQGVTGHKWEGIVPDATFLAFGDETTIVAYRGQQAPAGLEGLTFSYVDDLHPDVNALGQILFHVSLSGPGVSSENYSAGILYSNGRLERVVRMRDPAPGTGSSFHTVGGTLDDTGAVWLRGELVGEGIVKSNDSGIWYGAPGSFELVVREGQPAPGGGVYGDIWAPAVSGNGNALFMTDLNPDGPNNRALYAGTPGAFGLVARVGEPVVAGESAVADFGLTRDINQSGEVMFVARLESGQNVLYAGKSDGPQRVARTMAPAPGMPGQTLTHLYGADMNDQADVAFRGELPQQGAERPEGIWLGRPGEAAQLLAASGLDVPGLSDTQFWYFHDPVINAEGQVAFYAGFKGTGSRGPQDYAVLATGLDGELRVVARNGDSFEVASGDIRTIAALSPNGTAGTHELSFNAAGQIPLLVRFTDGSEGIFLMTVVPEPAAAIAVVSFVLFARPGSRRRTPEHRWRRV